MTEGRPIIPIQPADSGGLSHGNVFPLLHEVRHALERLLESSEETVIDLRAIPMGPGEEAAIEEALGTGEVKVHIRAVGPSTLQETAYPGVWLITHFNESDQVLSRFIEITYLPSIVKSQRDDVRDALDALTHKLEQLRN